MSPTSVMDRSSVPDPAAARRGVPVIPSSTDSSSTNTNKPSWLKDLKSRQSQKKPSSNTAVVKDEDSAPPAPSWLSNLKKTKQSSVRAPIVPKPFMQKSASVDGTLSTAASSVEPEVHNKNSVLSRLEPDAQVRFIKLLQYDTFLPTVRNMFDILILPSAIVNIHVKGIRILQKEVAIGRYVSANKTLLVDI